MPKRMPRSGAGAFSYYIVESKHPDYCAGVLNFIQVVALGHHRLELRPIHGLDL